LIKIIIGTVIFTSFDLVMAVSSIVGTRFGLIPSVKKQGITTENPEIKENFEQSLELATFVNDWLLGGTIGLIVAIVVIIAMLMSKDIALRRKGAYVLKRTPVLGALLENAAMSNSLTILSSLIESGVRMSNALTITLRATHHEGCLIYLRGIQNELSKGVSLRQAFAKDPMSIAEKIVIQSSNDSAQLSHSLKNIAQSREDIGKQLAKRFAMLALVISLGYSGISVGFSLWVVYIQNSALLGGG
jgi:type II secretory pathway component PulF